MIVVPTGRTLVIPANRVFVVSPSSVVPPYAPITSYTVETMPADGNGSTGDATSISFSPVTPDGQYCAVGYSTTGAVRRARVFKYDVGTSTWTLLGATFGTTASADTTYVSFSPDGNYLAVANSATTPRLRIYKRSGDTFSTTGVTIDVNLPNSGRQPAWSADGNYLVVGHSSSPFMSCYKRTGDAFAKLTNPALLPANNGYTGQAAWAPSDDVFAMGTSGGGGYVELFHLDKSTDTLTRLTRLTQPSPAGITWYHSWRPDGAHLTFGINSTTNPPRGRFNRLMSGSTEAGVTANANWPVTAAGTYAYYGMDWSPDGERLAAASGVGTVGVNKVEIYTYDDATSAFVLDPVQPSETIGTGMRTVAWSPDRRWLGYTYASGTTPYFGILRVNT